MHGGAPKPIPFLPSFFVLLRRRVPCVINLKTHNHAPKKKPAKRESASSKAAHRRKNRHNEKTRPGFARRQKKPSKLDTKKPAHVRGSGAS